MNLFLALRLRYSDRALALKERLQELCGHDISEILEWTLASLLGVLFRHWDLFTTHPDHLREALATDRVTRYLVKFDLSPSMYAKVIDELMDAIGELYNDLHDQVDPILGLLPADSRGFNVRVRGQSIYIEVGHETTTRPKTHDAIHRTPGDPGHQGFTGAL